MAVIRMFLIRVIGFFVSVQLASAQAHVTTEPVANDGTQVQVDLPKSLHMRNTGGNDSPRGPGHGSGLCVYTSVNQAASYQNVRALQEFQKWMMNHPGGGSIVSLPRWMEQMCRENGVPKPKILQVETKDLEFLKMALRNGMIPSVTYGQSPTGRYSGRRIPHMVNLFAAGAGNGPDGRGWYCVQDNNFPGTYEWMSESQFVNMCQHGGKYWAVFLLAPCPAPVPFN